jgi:hypothetical protein
VQVPSLIGSSMKKKARSETEIGTEGESACSIKGGIYKRKGK